MDEHAKTTTLRMRSTLPLTRTPDIAGAVLPSHRPKNINKGLVIKLRGTERGKNRGGTHNFELLQRVGLSIKWII